MQLYETASFYYSELLVIRPLIAASHRLRQHLSTEHAWKYSGKTKGPSTIIIDALEMNLSKSVRPPYTNTIADIIG